MMHMPCALTFVENHLVSQREPSGSGVVSCPNPAMHDSRRGVFWPRILELVDVAIPVSYHAGNERDALQARVASARERVRTTGREQGTRNLGPNVSPIRASEGMQ